MKKSFLVALAIAAAAILPFLASCKKSGPEAKPSDVDYYTCTMHPSVRSQDPHGHCPICGMELVPVKKSSGATMPAMGTNESAGEEKPADFTVPVDRQQEIGVTYETVQDRPLQLDIRAVGTVAYDKQRQWNYVARVDGYVQTLNVFSPGEVVEKSSPLLSIYSPELFTAQKELADALAMRDDAQAKGQPDVLKSAQRLVESGRERLRLWNITDEQINDLEKSRKPEESLTLFSPFKGVVQELDVEQGRRVAVGDRLVDVTDLSMVWVWAQFYQNELPLLKKGLPVTVTSDSFPQEKFLGKISLVDPFLNDASRTARVRVDVENPDFKLRPEMYVDVDVSMNMGKGLTVPVAAVLPTGLHNIAFVGREQGRLQPRFIELGRKFGGYYEVKSGLKKNERVVTSANFLIDAEAKVQGALKSW